MNRNFMSEKTAKNTEKGASSAKSIRNAAVLLMADAYNLTSFFLRASIMSPAVMTAFSASSLEKLLFLFISM